MKKKWIPFFLLCCLPLTLMAQEQTTEKSHHFELAINATRFLNDLVSFNSRTINSGPYVLGFKLFKGSTALRVGVGGRFNSERSNEEVTVVRDHKETEINVRAGLEKQFQIGKRWLYYIGADFTYSHLVIDDIVESDIDIVNTKESSNAFGAGPVIGVQFKISNRISLWTETSIYYTYIRKKEDSLSQLTPEFNKSIRSEIHQGIANLPVAIFFAIRL